MKIIAKENIIIDKIIYYKTGEEIDTDTEIAEFALAYGLATEVSPSQEAQEEQEEQE